MPDAGPVRFLALRFGSAAALLAIAAFVLRAPWARRGESTMRHMAVVGLLLHGVGLGGVWVALDLGVETGGRGAGDGHPAAHHRRAGDSASSASASTGGAAAGLGLGFLGVTLVIPSQAGRGRGAGRPRGGGGRGDRHDPRHALPEAPLRAHSISSPAPRCSSRLPARRRSRWPGGSTTAPSSGRCASSRRSAGRCWCSRSGRRWCSTCCCAGAMHRGSRASSISCRRSPR